MKTKKRIRPKKTFADRLITTIRKYSKEYPGQILTINFKTLRLISCSNVRAWEKEYLATLPKSIQAVICDPIPWYVERQKT